MMAQSLEQARGTMQNYLRFFEKSMVAMPWAKTDLSQKVMKHAEKNVMTAFGHAHKLTGLGICRKSRRFKPNSFKHD